MEDVRKIMSAEEIQEIRVKCNTEKIPAEESKETSAEDIKGAVAVAAEL